MKQSLITMNKILRESLYFRKDSNISRFSQILQHIFPNMIYTSAYYSDSSPTSLKKQRASRHSCQLGRDITRQVFLCGEIRKIQKKRGNIYNI